MCLNAAQKAALDVAKSELVRGVEAAFDPGCKAVNDRDRRSRSVDGERPRLPCARPASTAKERLRGTS